MNEESTKTLPVVGEVHPQSLTKVVLDYIKTILVTLAVAFFLKIFVLEAYRIPSGSMENTLMIGDFLLVNKLSYGFRTPHRIPFTSVAIPSFGLSLFSGVGRGDIVVFEYPNDSEYLEAQGQVNFIKRCVGLPGDTIALRSGRVFVNGRELTMPPHAKATEPSLHAWAPMIRPIPGGKGYTEDDFGPIVVPKRGERIPLSNEHRDEWSAFVAHEGHELAVGPDGKVLLDGRPASTYAVEQDYYFMLGDNRHNSLDSRFWGFVPEKNLIGEALMVYWSWDPDIEVLSVRDKLKSVRWSRIGTFIR